MNRNRRIALFAAALFCLSAVAFVAVAKYVKDVPFEGQVTFTADLADTFILTESEATRQTDGTYSLSGEQVPNNTYILMPGVDVPKDPKITITGKTAIPAYLYVEVSSNLPATVTYEMKGHWNLLTDVTGPKGGKVYVYDTLLDGTPADLTISILENNTVYVSDELSRDTAATLTFHAYLFQNIGTAKESFKPTTTP